MRGLLIKDIYTILKQMKVFIIIILIFQLLPDSVFSNIALLYGAMLPVTALAYDERSKWDKLASMLPYTAKELVLSKYLLGYMSIVLFALIGLAIKLITSSATIFAQGNAFFLGYAITLCLATLFQAVNLPFMFRFGVEKGRIFFFFLVGFIAFTGSLFEELVFDLFATNVNLTMLFVFIVIIVLINIISILASLICYQNKLK